jgi:hypothetical protein
MNSLGKAIKKKVGKVIDKGGDFIANRIMLQPSIDRAKGARADRMRSKIIQRRESRANDKAMGY